MTYYVLLSFLTVVVGWLFRMKKRTKAGYFMIGEEEGGGEVRIFSANDIDSIELHDVEDQTAWEEGMTLPSQPVLDNAPIVRIDRNNPDPENAH